MDRKKPGRLLFIFLLSVAGAVCAQAQGPTIRQRILIDGSASMDGFFNNGQIRQLHDAISKSLTTGTIDTYYFINERLETTEPQFGRFGSTTLLNNAFTQAYGKNPTPSIIWIITDNQPSVGSDTESDKDIDRFYAQLQSSQVNSIDLFPARLPFNGKLYMPSIDGREYGVPYNNKRGLLVYAILLDASAKASFAETVKNFTEQPFNRALGKDFQRISVKPLEHDTVTAKLIPGDKLRVRDDQISGGDFEEGKPIRGNVKLELTSQLGEIKIDDATIQVDKVDQFETGDFVTNSLVSTITPSSVKDFSPGPHNRKEFVVAFDVSSVHMKKTLAGMWNSIRNKRGYVRGKIRVTINVPPAKFSLVPELIKEFSTERDIYQNPSPDVQRRIYKLNALVNRMIPNAPLTIQPQVSNNSEGLIPVSFSVKYPVWPTFAVIGLATIFLLLPLTAILWVNRQPRYRLTWNQGKFRACPDFKLWPFVGRSVDINNRPAATIKRTLAGIKIRARHDFTVDQAAQKVLNPHGTDFNVARRDDGGGVNFSFLKAGRFRAAARASNNKDIFSEISYGGGSEIADGHDEIRDQPIRMPTTTSFEKTSARRKPADDDLDLDSLLG
jgi:hypothetical protein